MNPSRLGGYASALGSELDNGKMTETLIDLTNLACPYCGYDNYEFPGRGIHVWNCAKCHHSMSYCYNCGTFTLLHRDYTDEQLCELREWSVCRQCGNYSEASVVKSHLYSVYNFAFKFVNSVRTLSYPLYFEEAEDNNTWSLPLGIILSDLGPLKNDFKYADSKDAYGRP